MRLTATATFLLPALLLLCIPAWAHEAPPPAPSAEELRQVGPEIPGAVEFARALLGERDHHLTGDQLDRLGHIGQCLAWADGLRLGRMPDGAQVAPDTTTTQQLASYHRWRTERELLALAETLPGLIVLEDRPGAAAPHTITLDLDAQAPTVFLKVKRGDGPLRFSVIDLDLTTERPADGYRVKVQPAGTTWVLLRLSAVPAGPAGINLALVDDGADQPTHWHSLRFATARPGQLGLTVLDETGRSAPVLLRLTARPSGRLWEPAGAVDLRPLMNLVTGLPIYGPGRAYTIYTPGRFQGHYWVVPGPFEMALPPGEWEVHILHGPEYAPLHDTFRVESGQWTRKTLQLTRWTDMPARGWFAGDDHVHARLMGSDDAAALLAFARAADIHVANILEMGDGQRTWYNQRGFGPDFRIHDDGNHWLVPGQEDPRSMLGHAIGMNLTGLARDLDHYMFNDWVAGEIHRQGGLYGHTHVGPNACLVHREMTLFTPLGIVDFNSVMQATLGTQLYYEFLNLGYKMTASAGSDTPYGGTVGAVRVYANAGKDKPFTPDAWFNAVRAGRTFVTNGPMLELTVEDQTSTGTVTAGPGDELMVATDRPLRVRARAWGLARESAPQRLELVWLGEAIKMAATGGPAQGELALEETVPSGDGGWLAVHAVGANGSEALTTPVYVTRPGFRHWAIGQVEALVSKRLVTLDEIEGAITESERIYRQTGPEAADGWNRWPAEQAAALRERIAQARAHYQGLLAIREDELRRRPSAQ